MIEAQVVASDPQYDPGKAAPATMDTAGRLRIASLSSASITAATRSDVAVATASTVVLAANPSRKPGSRIACDTTSVSYFLLAATGAGPANFIGAVDAKTTVPGIFNVPDGYLGAVCAVGSAANGSWRVTEMT